MRWIAVLLGLTLLIAGATPKRAIHDRDRPNDEIAATGALAKLAVRRHDGARPVGNVGLDRVALVTAEPDRDPPSTCIEVVFTTPAAASLGTHDSFDARAPPLG